MTNPTTEIAIVNNTGSSDAYAYVSGLDLNNNNAPIFLQADGKTVYTPANPSAPQTPLGADVAIPLGAAGSTTHVTIPQIAGGRIWFTTGGGKLAFRVNPGPAVVEPSPTNPADPSYDVAWDFCEFTYNAAQLFVNITYVDFVALPIALRLENTAGAVQTVAGLPADGLDRVCAGLAAEADDPGWAKLVVKGRANGGANLRALSPNAGRVLDGSLFAGYYDGYVDAVWAKYSGPSSALTVSTPSWGSVQGTVQGDALTFPGLGAFARPTAADVFSCSTGPFGNYPAATAEAMGAVGARLAAAFNRSTLLLDDRQPDGEVAGTFYRTSPTNQYARIVHAANLDGRGYAFPYDDVGPDGSALPDQAGTVFDGSPKLLTVTVGGPGPQKAVQGGQKAVDAGDGTKKQGEEEGADKEKNKKQTDGGGAAVGKKPAKFLDGAKDWLGSAGKKVPALVKKLPCFSK